MTQIVPPPTKIQQYLLLNKDMLECQAQYVQALEKMKFIDPLNSNFDELARTAKTQFIYLQATAAKQQEVVDTLTTEDLKQAQQCTD